MKRSVLLFLLFASLFGTFTFLLIERYIEGPIYLGLFSICTTIGLCLFFADRVKEVDLRQIVIKLYEKSREGIIVDALAVNVAKILDDTKLITRFMASTDEKESEIIRQEINKRGLFD